MRRKYFYLLWVASGFFYPLLLIPVLAPFLGIGLGALIPMMFYGFMIAVLIYGPIAFLLVPLCLLLSPPCMRKLFCCLPVGIALCGGLFQGSFRQGVTSEVVIGFMLTFAVAAGWVVLMFVAERALEKRGWIYDKEQEIK